MALEIKPVVRPNKTFQQPASKKTRPAGDEYALAAQFVPKPSGVIEDVVEITGQAIIRHCYSQASITTWFGGTLRLSSSPERVLIIAGGPDK